MSVWSPFAKAVTDIVPLGHENHSVTIQKLGWKALADAAQENQRKGIALAREIGPGGLLTEITKQGGEDEIHKKANADPFLQYDREILLVRGIKAWTLPEPRTDEAIADLATDVAEMLARKIYELSKPPTEEERKNA
jgi:hypothetical protein